MLSLNESTSQEAFLVSSRRPSPAAAAAVVVPVDFSALTFDSVRRVCCSSSVWMCLDSSSSLLLLRRRQRRRSTTTTTVVGALFGRRVVSTSEWVSTVLLLLLAAGTEDHLRCLPSIHRDGILRCDGVCSKRRMNTDGRDERAVPSGGGGSGFTSTTTTTTTTIDTTGEQMALSSLSSWHHPGITAAAAAAPITQSAAAAAYGLRLGHPAATSSFFRSPPVTPLEQSARIFPFEHIAASYGSLFSLVRDRPQFPLAASPGFYSRLSQHQRPSFSPVSMTAGIQQPYLAPSESYAQNLIQLSQLPHLIQQQQQQQPMPYPSYLGSLSSLGGDSIIGRHVMTQHQQQQPSPLPLNRLTPIPDPFQRSPISESLQSLRSPVQHPYKEERSSYHSPPVHHQGTRSGSGPRSLVYFSPPLTSLPHQQTARKSTVAVAEPEVPTCQALVKDPAPLRVSSGHAAAAAAPREGPLARAIVTGESQFPRRPTAHRPRVRSTGTIQSISPLPVAEVRTSMTSTAPRSQAQQPHYPPHFTCGSIIQLGDGQLKRVEDLETRDFIDSASSSDNLRIDSSTVIHMRQNHERNTVVLGFSVGEQNIQVTVEATLEHPFFVYNQGWSSYSPERTLLRYGLTCRQLVVGNCCISLTQRESRPQLVAEPPAGQTAVPPGQQQQPTWPSRSSSSESSHLPHRISHAIGAPGARDVLTEMEVGEDVSPNRLSDASLSLAAAAATPEQHSQSSSYVPRRLFPLPSSSSSPAWPSSSGIATHSVISAVVTKTSRIATSTQKLALCFEIPSSTSASMEPSATTSGSLRGGRRGGGGGGGRRKRRWSAPEVFHRDNIPRAGGGAAGEETTAKPLTSGLGSSFPTSSSDS